MNDEKMLSVLAVARGEAPADLLLVGGQVVNVFSREVLPANVAVAQGVIAGVGPEYKDGVEILDLSGKVLVPGLIDAHLHIESTLLLPAELARVVVPRGTTAMVSDPHEIANVLGPRGVVFLMDAARDLPLDVFFTAPSCVPATGMETAGGEVTAADVARLVGDPGVVALGEVMNFPGAVAGATPLLAMMAAARARGKLVDGHAPRLSGLELQAYLANGISTDHECTSAAEALEKIRAGMKVIIRQGSAARNLADLLPLISPHLCENLMFGSDDREAADLLARGDVNAILQEVVDQGADPVLAVTMATLNPARHYRLTGRGGLAPGYLADVVVLGDLAGFEAETVIKNGRVVARDGNLTIPISGTALPQDVVNTVYLPRSPRSEDFRVIPPPGPVPVIGVVPGQVVTEKLFLDLPRAADGTVSADPAGGLAVLAVVERHSGSGRVAAALVRGLGLRRGAIASSVAHDSHNLIVAGIHPAAMAAAVAELARLGGGFAAVDETGQVLAALPLPVAGLISDQPAHGVAEGVKRVTAAARALGAGSEQPFLTLSFLALPVIPSLKLTDRGLVDVDRFCLLESGR